MTTATRTRKSPIVAADRAHPEHPAHRDRRLNSAMTFARARVRRLIEWLPGTWKATMAGANDTTSELQRLPDSTLQLLAAGSFGLGAGFYFSGAPRVIVAAGFTPAVVMGAAIFLRPIMPARGRQALREVEAQGLPHVTNQHTKGAISKAQGKVEEEVGKVTGDEPKQARGKIRQVQGEVQQGLGDLQDTIRRTPSDA